MEITILLKQYCIRTAARRKHSTLIHQYFGGAFSDREKVAAEAQIEALKFFLEKMDFNRLRFDFPELSGSKELPVKLIIPENRDEIIIQFKDKQIKPEWKEHR